MLNEAFAIDARDPDADQVDFVKNVYGAFTGRMQVTSFRFAPGAGDPKKMEFDDRGDFIVDTATAWPVKVRHLRRFSSTHGSRVDTVELTRL